MFDVHFVELRMRSKGELSVPRGITRIVSRFDDDDDDADHPLSPIPHSHFEK